METLSSWSFDIIGSILVRKGPTSVGLLQEVLPRYLIPSLDTYGTFFSSLSRFIKFLPQTKGLKGTHEPVDPHFFLTREGHLFLWRFE